MAGETEKKTETTTSTTTADDKSKAAATETKTEKQETTTETSPEKKEERSELAGLFDEGDKDKGAKKTGEEKSADKGAADLKVTVPDDLKDVFGDPADFVKLAKEEGLTQKQLDRVMAVQFDRVKAALQGNEESTERTTLEWKRDLRSDSKLGGANLPETMRVAERGARALGGSMLAVKLAKHFRGEESIDGPTLIRAFHMAGLAQNEDRIGDRGSPAVKKDDDAGLTPQERDFKRSHPNTWKKMQEEKAARAG
jgi:hypothetical protein